MSDLIVSQPEDSQELALLSTKQTNDMINPCAIYWDFENVKVESAPEADQFIQRVRSEVILNKGLREVEFVCVCGNRRLPLIIENQIKSARVKVFYVPFERNAADWKIVELINKYVKSAGPGCNLALISGDSDFTKTLYRCKIYYNAKIYLIHCYHQKSDSLDAVTDELYLYMEDKQLRQVTNACDVAVINIKPPPEVYSLPTLADDLFSIFKSQGVTKESIFFDRDQEKKCIWVGFSSKKLAKNVEKNPDHKLLKRCEVNYVQYPPKYVIKQLINYNGGRVREETLKTLQLSNPRLLSSSQISLTPSTLSLTFKSASPAYIIVTSTPFVSNYNKRRHLSELLDKHIKSFKTTPDSVWFEVHHAHQAREYIDKINDSNCFGSQLSATIEKHPPGQLRFSIPSTDSESFFCSFQCIQLSGFVLLVIIIIGIIIWAKW